MHTISKEIFSFIGQLTAIIIVWIGLIVGTLFLLEYLGEQFLSYITRETDFESEGMIDRIEQAYPSQLFTITLHGNFETGTLEGWEASGEAFAAQPTFEDNPLFRGIPIGTNIEGSYWIGTFEKHPDTSYVRGSVQGDELIGTLTSGEFIIDKPILSFLIGGGKGLNTRAELLVEGTRVAFWSGENAETMRRVRTDVSPYIGKKARICLVDYSKGHWGHINFDDLKLEE